MEGALHGECRVKLMLQRTVCQKPFCLDLSARWQVVRVDRAEFYRSDKEWRSGNIPLKVLSLRQSRATQKQGTLISAVIGCLIENERQLTLQAIQEDRMLESGFSTLKRLHQHVAMSLRSFYVHLFFRLEQFHVCEQTYTLLSVAT